MNKESYKLLSPSDRQVLDFLKARCFGGIFTMTQGDVAAVLKVNVKTVCRAFKKLQQLDIIAKAGKNWALSPLHFFNMSEELYAWKLSEFSELVAKSRPRVRPGSSAYPASSPTATLTRSGLLG